MVSCADKKHYIFRSFWDRDDCYKMLDLFLKKFKFGLNDDPISLNNLISGSLPPPDAHRASTMVERPTNLDDLIQPPATQSIAETITPGSSTTNSNSPLSNTYPDQKAGNTSGGIASTVSTNSLRTTTGSTGTDEEEVDTEIGRDRASTTSSNKDSEVAFTAEATKCKLKLPIISQELELSIENFSKLFIDEGAPYSFKSYHASVKDTNLVLSSWADESAARPGQYSRELKFLKPVNLPGLPSTRGVKIQRLVRFGETGMILCSSTRLEDTPAADTFMVEDALIIKSMGANSVHVDISFEVKFVKSTFMKYLIETNTNTELTKWLQVYFEHLKNITALFNEGKIDLNAPAVVIAPPSAEQVANEKKAAAEAAATAAKEEAEAESKRRAKHDYFRLAFYVFMIIFLLLNYSRWSNANSRVVDMEETIRNLEKILSKFVEERGKDVCSK